MSEAVLSSLIALIGTMIGTFGGILVSNRLTNYRVEQLEKKVEKHNQVTDRVYELEKNDAVQDEEIKVANHRIDDLEAKVG